MCGITGILGNGESTVLGSMSNNLSHRGPDGFGSFESDLMIGSICLAQSRLAIVDVNGSKQPIESEHNCILVQNGDCLLYTSPSPRDRTRSRMPSSA